MTFPAKGKLLALDLGTCRTGVAVTDESRRIAFMRDEIEHKSTEELLVELEKIITDEKIAGIVMGMPLNMSGQKTAQTEITQEIVNTITEKFDLPTELADERLTSIQARKTIFGKGYLDSRAAQLMLEMYLD
jgi:putative holliday junction resolvase